MDPERCDPPEENYTYRSIGYCVPRRDKRTVGVGGNLSPVEGDWDQRDPSPPTKKLVHDNIVGSNPNGEREDAEERRDEAREPVPAERTGEDDEEVFVAGNGPSITLCWVGL